jgi:predicted dehydrogenase
MRVAVVGIRGMGQSHVVAAKAWSKTTDVVGCDLDPQVRATVGAALGIETFADVATMIRDAKPEVMFIATPPSSHAVVARAAFAAGIPVLVEKPICADLAEAEELVRLAENLAIPFQCAFQLRYAGYVQAIDGMIATGELGTINHVGLVQMSGPKSEHGYMARTRVGGIFYEKLCHQVDLFRHLLGEPQRVMAAGAPRSIAHYGIEDNVHAVFSFSGGRLGTIRFETRRSIQVDGTARPERSVEGPEAGHFYEVVVTGDRGTAVYDTWRNRLDVVRFNHRPDLLNELVRRIDLTKEFGHDVYDLRPQNHDFCERVAAGKPPRFPASDALRSMAWVERAERSLREDGAWIGADQR